MEKILPFDDDEILLRVARRRHFRERAEQRRFALRQDALDSFVAQRLLASGRDPATVRREPHAWDALRKRYARQHAVSYTTPVNDKKLNDEIQAAEDQLSSDYSTERWRLDNCGCVVQRVFLEAEKHRAQTFQADPCAFHPGLTLEQLHDAHEEETARRYQTFVYLLTTFEGLLSERMNDQLQMPPNQPPTIGFSWTPDRVLVVTAPLLNEGQRASVVAWADAVFGPDRIQVG